MNKSYFLLLFTVLISGCYSVVLEDNESEKEETINIKGYDIDIRNLSTTLSEVSDIAATLDLDDNIAIELTKALKSDAVMLNEAAFLTLKDYKSKFFLDYLQSTIDNKNINKVRKLWMVALLYNADIDTDINSQYIMKALDDKNEWVQFNAFHIIPCLGAKGAKFSEKLANFCLEDDKHNYSSAAFISLERLGPNAKDALPYLLELLSQAKENKNYFKCQQIIRVIGNIGASRKEGKKIVDIFEKFTQEEFPLRLRRTVIYSLRNFPTLNADKIISKYKDDKKSPLHETANEIFNLMQYNFQILNLKWDPRRRKIHHELEPETRD